jgi:hypothetical protein
MRFSILDKKGECMKMNFGTIATSTMLAAVLSIASVPAEAQSGANWDFDLGPSNGQIAAVVAGIAVTGAAIGIGIYFLARHDRTLTGCTASGLNGLILQKEHDPETYTLLGVTKDIKPGERVRVSGKKKTKTADGYRTFLVEKVSKDLGPCPSDALVKKHEAN